MDFYNLVTFWIFQPYSWLILGIIIIIFDIFFLGMVLLPFGLSSLIIATLLYFDYKMYFSNFVFFETWRDILIYYAIFSIISLGAIKFFLRKNKTSRSDINEY